MVRVVACADVYFKSNAFALPFDFKQETPWSSFYNRASAHLIRASIILTIYLTFHFGVSIN